MLEPLFNKVADLSPATLLRRNSNRAAFLWNSGNLSEYFFYRTPPVAASANTKPSKKGVDIKRLSELECKKRIILIQAILTTVTYNTLFGFSFLTKYGSL